MGEGDQAAKKAKARGQAVPSRERERLLKRTAKALFHPRDRNPYMFNGKPLRNLQDLADYLVAFDGREGPWVASWLEYLGDKEAADRIRRHPKNFKKIVAGRYDELKKYAGKL